MLFCLGLSSRDGSTSSRATRALPLSRDDQPPPTTRKRPQHVLAADTPHGRAGRPHYANIKKNAPNESLLKTTVFERDSLAGTINEPVGSALQRSISTASHRAS